MDIAGTARAALEVLTRDGWNQGALTWVKEIGPEYREGSHCIGGAVNMVTYGCDEWNTTAEPVYQEIRKVIEAQYPEFTSARPTRQSIHDILFIATWNNDENTTEADVRLVLEKVAAK
jgi:hypothetical protein